MVKNMIGSFEYFVKKGDIRKMNGDKEKAISLLKISEKRIEEMNRVVTLSIKLELLYEAILELIDALLSLEGYKSYSHIASISYLRKLGLSEYYLENMDMFRKLRHKSKYYGEVIDKEDFKKFHKFGIEIYEKLRNILKDKI